MWMFSGAFGLLPRKLGRGVLRGRLVKPEAHCILFVNRGRGALRGRLDKPEANCVLFVKLRHFREALAIGSSSSIEYQYAAAALLQVIRSRTERSQHGE